MQNVGPRDTAHVAFGIRHYTSAIALVFLLALAVGALLLYEHVIGQIAQAVR